MVTRSPSLGDLLYYFFYFYIFYFCIFFSLLKGRKLCGHGDLTSETVARVRRNRVTILFRDGDHGDLYGDHGDLFLLYKSISLASSSFNCSLLYISIGSSLSFIPLNPRFRTPFSLNLTSLTPSNDAIYFKNAR